MALTQMPAPATAGPLLLSPSPLLGCWPQARLSCSSFFIKRLLQFVPRHQGGLLCPFGARTGSVIPPGGQFLPDLSHIPVMCCLRNMQWRYNTSPCSPGLLRLAESLSVSWSTDYLYMKQYAGWMGRFLLSGSRLWLKIILI